MGSRTARMTAGAALGDGIYLAKQMKYSLGYTRSRPSWPESQLGSLLSCIALCEVINKPEFDKNGVFVVPDEACVITRFLLVSKAQASSGHGSGFQGSIDATQLVLPQNIQGWVEPPPSSSTASAGAMLFRTALRNSMFQQGQSADPQAPMKGSWCQ